MNARKRKVKTPDQFNALVDEAIKELCGDNVQKGAECLIEIAQLWHKAGLPKKNFFEMRQYIINEAIERTDKLFIYEKVQIAERKLREQRTNTVILLN